MDMALIGFVHRVWEVLFAGFDQSFLWCWGSLYDSV